MLLDLSNVEAIPQLLPTEAKSNSNTMNIGHKKVRRHNVCSVFVNHVSKSFWIACYFGSISSTKFQLILLQECRAPLDWETLIGLPLFYYTSKYELVLQTHKEPC